MIEANTPMLLCRVYDYKFNDFIAKHIEVLVKYNEVWMLKSGKTISSMRLKSVLDSGGFIILKTPKRSSDKFHLCMVDKVSYTKPVNANLYPGYYEQYMQENGWSGQWFRIRSVHELMMDDVNKLKMVVNDKSVADVVDRTQASFMYVTNKDVLNIS